MKILIVEDEFNSREGLAELIGKISCEYVVCGKAADGEQGFKLATTLRPDLIFVDIEMPKLNGLDMIEKILAVGMNPYFVVLSGYAEFKFAQKGISLGVTQYLLKPITYEDLKKVLEEMKKKIGGKNTCNTKLIRQMQANDEAGIDTASLLVRKTVNYIKNNYNGRISLEELAEKLNVTPEYISHLFTKEIGQSFSSYVKEYRIKLAEKLIMEGSLKLYEIGERVGYKDPKYFNKMFKEVTGICPKKYLIIHKI
ncbi:Hypothetical protein LUCI_0947 [Lucifera butyrica]|uniref:Stage 0 sporulation protein A homolog n=1 Tax=Lucifera butyrica TaxID=1351585 RepID=A0A498QZT1_9FIRM|nr:response regulator [Lucifera butyrica]VBB05736.1 Hypothetical protein LUCI_0947 [Lucifera butyrica]